MQRKRCNKCRQLKQLAAFNRRTPDAAGRYKDGHDYECKECNAARQKKWAQTEHGKKTRQASGKRFRSTDRGKELARKKSKLDKVRYREAYLARTITNNAIKLGKLVRQPCEVCGVEPTEAHHEDYSKPLEVRWLCPKHHRDVHT
jgi:hypothetical protein